MSNERDNEPVLLVINTENILIHIGAPATFKKKLLTDYVIKGYTLRTVTIKEFEDMGAILYQPLPSPPSI